MADGRGVLDVEALAGGDGTDLAQREEDLGALDHGRGALGVEETDEGLAGLEFHDGVFGLEGGIGAEGLGGSTDGFLVLGGIGPQGMLDTVAELAEDAVGDIGRVLRDEIDADALASDQAHHLLDLADQGRGGVGEKGVGLVEEEDELRQLLVADFGKLSVDVGEQPEEVGRVELRVEHQLVRREDAHDTLAALDGEEVVDVEGRLAEETVRALVLQREQRALNRAHGGRGDVAIGLTELRSMVGDVAEHRPEILEVEEQEAPLVGDAEEDVHDAGLRLVEAEETAQQLRAHVGDGGPHRMALLAEDIVETGRTARELRRLEAELGEALLNEAAQLAGLADAGEVALHVGHETGHARLGETLGQDLEGHCLAGAGRAGDESVAIRHLADNGNGALRAVGDIKSVGAVVHGIAFCFRKYTKIFRILCKICGRSGFQGRKFNYAYEKTSILGPGLSFAQRLHGQIAGCRPSQAYRFRLVRRSGRMDLVYEQYVL